LRQFISDEWDLASRLLFTKASIKEIPAMNAIAKDIKSNAQSLSEASDCSFDISVQTDCAVTEVPLKPSAAMLAEGARAGGVSVETAWKIYLAMLRSAR